MNEASAQREELLGILRSYEGLDLTPRSLVTVESIYADLVRRRAFRTTMFHSRDRFERAMGFYFGAVLVEMKRARWSDAADGVGVERVDGSGALPSLGSLCRDWFKRSQDEERDSLIRLLDEPWGLPVAHAVGARRGKKRASAQTRRTIRGKPPTAVTFADLEPALRASVRPYVRLIAVRAKEPLPLWSSKGGDGRPYLPKTAAWPSVGKEQLSHVLQVDFADVPPMPAFPRSGLFSLFLSEDLTRAKVLYFPRIIRDVSKLWSDFSRVPDVGDVPGPYARPVRLRFEKREGCVPMRDYRFDEIVGREFAAALPASPNFDSIYDRIWRWSGADDSRIGGYASPGQDDPRARKARRGFDVTLLELQNDNFTLDLFIESARLRRRDFSRVFYHGACD